MNKIITQPDGKILLVGIFSQVDGVFRPGIARLLTNRQATPYDFDGDGKTDVGIFRPSTGAWWVSRSASNVVAVAFGTSADKIVPADFTGDGKSDLALFRESTGQWLVLRSEDNTFYGFPFGAAGDKAVPSAYLP